VYYFRRAQQRRLDAAWVSDEDKSFQDALFALDANVRRIADKQGLTIAEVAERSSMARTHLYDILAGRKRVRLDVLTRIADALGTPVWKLLKPPRE
jgi:predicted transcriptional regulator